MLHDDPPVKDDNGALAIAADILLSLPSNIWWRLLQDPDGEIDVSTGSRQEWAHIIPVYLKAGLYLAPNIVGTDYKLQFNKEKWDELKLFLAKRNGVLLELSPIRNKGEGASHHVTVSTPAKRQPKFKSAIRQAVEVAKNELAAIGVDSLRGTRRNTRQNNVDDCAMKEKLEQFCAAFRDEFLSFASDQLSEDVHLMEAIKQYTMELMAASEELKRQQQQSERISRRCASRTARILCIGRRSRAAN